MCPPNEFPTIITRSNFLNTIKSFKNFAKFLMFVFNNGKEYKGNSGIKTL